MELFDDDLNHYVYTDIGHKRDGVWTTTGELWQKGVCIMQFNRSCPAGKAEVRLPDNAKRGKADKRKHTIRKRDWLTSKVGHQIGKSGRRKKS